MTDAPDSMLVHCGSCRHEWVALKLPMPLEEATKRMTEMCCPECDTPSTLIYCGTAPVNISAERVKKQKKVNMSDDLVKRLRQYPNVKLPNEAADRIAQLEDALKELLSLGEWGLNDLARTVAREALEGKEGA